MTENNDLLGYKADEGDLTFGQSNEAIKSLRDRDGDKQLDNRRRGGGGPGQALDARVLGTDLFGEPLKPDHNRGPMAQEFGWPPFTVFNAQAGAWQERKRAWLSLGIKGEEGRGAESPVGDKAIPGGTGANSAWLVRTADGAQSVKALGLDSGAGRANRNLHMVPSTGASTIDFYAQKRKLEKELGRSLTYQEAEAIVIERGSGFNARAEARLDSREGRDADLIPYSDTAKAKWNGALRKDPGMAFASGSGSAASWQAKNKMAFAPPEGEYEYDVQMLQRANGTSIFDPVLCELLYRWFCPEGGQVLDPFAGGSVRGIVASILGRRYLGTDLSERQVAANRPQAEALCQEPLPEWVVDDSRACLWPVDAADFVFSCPPYADLERYSEDPRDLSTMSWEAFRKGYRESIANVCRKLKADRFACFVVGEVRDTKTGHYRGLVAETIQAFEAAGLAFYNDAILVTAVGSLPVRVPTQFRAGRKLGKTHQNVLVFVKGNWKAAAQACQPRELPAAGSEDEAPGVELTDEEIAAQMELGLL